MDPLVPRVHGWTGHSNMNPIKSHCLSSCWISSWGTISIKGFLCVLLPGIPWRSIPCSSRRVLASTHPYQLDTSSSLFLSHLIAVHAGKIRIGNLMTMHVFKFIASVIGPSLVLGPFLCNGDQPEERFQSERFRPDCLPAQIFCWNLAGNVIFFFSDEVGNKRGNYKSPGATRSLEFMATIKSVFGTLTEMNWMGRGRALNEKRDRRDEVSL